MTEHPEEREVNTEEPVKNEASGLGWLFFIAMALHVLQALAFSLLVQKGIEPPVEMQLVSSELSILIPAIIYVLIKKLGFREDLGFCRIKTGTFFMCILLTLLIMPIAAFFNVLSQLFVSNTMVQMSDELLSGSDIAVLLIGGIFGPVCEEFLCRSLFFKRYETIAGPLRAGFISAVLFALAHMNINQACYAFALGVIFCIINKAAGSVYPSVIIHSLINILNIGMIMIAVMTSKAMGDDIDIAAAAESARGTDYMYFLVGVTLVMAIVCAVIAIPCTVFIAKHEGQLDQLKDMFTKKHEKGRWLSASLIIGVCFVLFIMFGLEPVLNLFT